MPEKQRKRRIRRVLWIGYRAAKRLLCTLLMFILFYAVLCGIGMIPTNWGFQNQDDGVEIFVWASDIHADLILPVKNDVIDWSTLFPADHFEADDPLGSHVAIGWGDRGFYLYTPAWSDLKVSTVSNALFLPSRTVMHVSHTYRPKLSDHCRQIYLSDEQYHRLVEYIMKSFQRGPDDQIVPIPGYTYTEKDAFYQAHGSYHIFNTCNNWTGRALRKAGAKTGLWTPFPKMVLFYLPPALDDPDLLPALGKRGGVAESGWPRHVLRQKYRCALREVARKVSTRIFLVGVSCIGKTTIGAELAAILGVAFVDLDEEIERFFKKPVARLQAETLTSASYRAKACQALRHKRRKSRYASLAAIAVTGVSKPLHCVWVTGVRLDPNRPPGKKAERHSTSGLDAVVEVAR